MSAAVPEPYRTPPELLRLREAFKDNMSRLRKQATCAESRIIRLTRSAVAQKPPTDKLLRIKERIEGKLEQAERNGGRDPLEETPEPDYAQDE